MTKLADDTYIVSCSIRGVWSHTQFPFTKGDFEEQRKRAWEVYETAKKRGADEIILFVQTADVIQKYSKEEGEAP